MTTDVLWLYAVALGSPAPAGLGANRERLEVLRLGRVDWIFGRRAPAQPDPKALLAQDRIVRRLWRGSNALLPLRFGESVESVQELRDLSKARSELLRERLRAVGDAAQLTLRIPADPPVRRPPPARPRTGTEYLTARFEAHQATRRAPELEPIRPLLDPLVREERVVRHGSPPLATVYLLVDRGPAARYRLAIERRARALGLAAVVTGPFPPYAFGPTGA